MNHRTIPTEPLTPEQHDLVAANLRLVPWAIGRFYGAMPEVERADAEQNGYTGLVRAAQKFDPAKGRFSTYAVWWIRQNIDRGRPNFRNLHRVGSASYQPPRSLDQLIGDDITLGDRVLVDTTADPAERSAERDELHRWRTFAATYPLTDRDRRILDIELEMAGHVPYHIDQRIAAELACTVETARRRRGRIHEILRSAWLTHTSAAA